MMALVMDEPAALPVTLAEVKAFLRLEGSAEDAMLAALLRSATATCEAFVGQTLLSRIVSETVLAVGGWARLSVAPVRVIDTVVDAGSGAMLPPQAYAVDIDGDGNGWVRGSQAGGGPVRVTYTAGLAEDANGVPEPIRHGILRLAAHSYGARGETEAPPPAGIAALWRPWRRLRAG